MKVEVGVVEKVLKDTYLEIGNKPEIIADLHSDGDRVAVVCSKFRQTALNSLHQVVQEEKQWGYSPQENVAICEGCGYEHYLGTYHQYATNYCPNCGEKMKAVK